MSNKLAFILGIRPDVIRAALVINQLRRCSDMEYLPGPGSTIRTTGSSFFPRARHRATTPSLFWATDAEVVASVVCDSIQSSTT